MHSATGVLFSAGADEPGDGAGDEPSALCGELAGASGLPGGAALGALCAGAGAGAALVRYLRHRDGASAADSAD